MREHFVKVYTPINQLGTEIVIGYYEDKKIYILHNEQFNKYNEGERIEPTLRLSYPFMQDANILTELVDSLIEQGAKPTKPIKNNEELEAIKYHLEDMRKIVFKLK